MLAFIRSLRAEAQEFTNMASRFATIIRSLTLSVLVGAAALLLICLILMTGSIRVLLGLMLTTPIQNLLYIIALLLIFLSLSVLTRTRRTSITPSKDSKETDDSTDLSAELVQEVNSTNLEVAPLVFSPTSRFAIPTSINRNDENVLNLLSIGLPIASHFYAVFAKESRVKKLIAIFLLCGIGIYYFLRRAPNQNPVTSSPKSLFKTLFGLLLEYNSHKNAHPATKRS